MKLLCKIFHRWTNIDGSKNSHSNQKCRRCGVLRDYYGTGGWGCYGEPYTPKTEVACHHQYAAAGLGTGRCVRCDAIKHYQPERTAQIANEMVEEIWKLRNENAKLKAANCRITPQDIADTMPPRVGWDL